MVPSVSTAIRAPLPVANPLPPKVILFDLLSALLDSWSLWDGIAGGKEAGRRWRMEYLERTYATGAYVPYLDLVADSAEAVGLSRARAAELEARWDELAPWPGLEPVLRELARDRPLGVVTNCSELLGRRAAALAGPHFSAVVTAESAGFYKPDPRIYMAGIEAMHARQDEVLFVAGSPFDVVGAHAAGLSVVWHNPAKLAGAEAGRRAVAVLRNLADIRTLLV